MTNCYQTLSRTLAGLTLLIASTQLSIAAPAPKETKNLEPFHMLVYPLIPIDSAEDTDTSGKGGASCGTGRILSEETHSVMVCCAYAEDEHGRRICIANAICKQTTFTCTNADQWVWTSTGVPYDCDYGACPQLPGDELSETLPE